VLAQAQKAVAARRRDADTAAQALDACQKRLAEAKEADKAKAKQGPAQSAGSSNGVLANGATGASPSKEDLDAKFALPAHLKDYTGACAVGHCLRLLQSSRNSTKGQAFRAAVLEVVSLKLLKLHSTGLFDCCVSACRAVLCCGPTHIGPEDDRKAKLAWRQEKAAEEKRLAQER
jgi:hypothetical protein